MSRNHIRLDRRRWAAVRRAVFERDAHRCTVCGKAGRMEAHHEPPLRAGANPYAVDKVFTYCRSCHIERHRPDDETPGRGEWRDLLTGRMSSDFQEKA